jgi:hypothetical protein
MSTAANNTAAGHLLNFLGREYIELQLGNYPSEFA